ncbi:MAG: alkaline phosphatase family protein [Acidimicrobiales bacterium]
MALALPPAGPVERERALEVLLSSALEPIVDLTAWSEASDVYDVASAHGHLRFRRVAGDGGRSDPAGPRYETISVSGENPLALQDPAHLGTLTAEMAEPHPVRRSNSYPHAFDHIAQLFDHPSAPDLVVLHSGAHYWGDQGGHLGEHGSLGVVQARAPFVVAGAGVAARGMVDASCRLVDVAPTILELLGCPAPPGTSPSTRLVRQDGGIVAEVVAAPGAARHVVAFLLDGTNPNVLYDMAGRGDAPNVARLMDLGTTYRHGAIASLPTVTLANHTAILTGCHPGHHGVLHNAWIDRATAEQVVTNSPSTWTTAMTWLSSGVETVHDAVHRGRPGSTTISINEPCDVGADYSVFDLMRRGEPIDRPPPAEDLPDATERFVRPSKDYRWSSLIDHTAVDQFCGIWSGRYRDRDWSVPAFSWVNFTLTDAAFHEGGPYSEIAASSVRDTDARIGRVLDAVERAGVLDRTAFLLVADHGMQLADPEVTGDWGVALAEAGVGVRDEGYGFLYLPGAGT